jgi:two-component system, chemotaxis family, chemotaxis protein CheY
MVDGKQYANKIQVLLIEANYHIRRPLEQILLARGHQCTAAESGQQGLSAVRNHYYDVVICNQQLPDISGMEFFRRSCVCQTGTTTILTATFADDDLVNKALADRIMVFLEMPYKVNDLLACTEGRFSDIHAGSLGRNLYITSGGQIMMISPAGLNKNQAVDGLQMRRRCDKPSAYKGGSKRAVRAPIFGNRVNHGTGFKALKPQS